MRHRPLALPLLLLTLLFALDTTTARADDERDYDETARVARISLIKGDVSLLRAGSKKWERAALNFPLVEGDRLATGDGARVELQIDARNFVRLGPYTTLDVVTLRDEGVALSLPEGTVTLRLARFEREREYFELDAPRMTVAAERTGLFRLDAPPDGRVRVTVRDGGRARLYSDNAGFTLRDGRTAEFAYNDAPGEGDWEFTAARAFDEWDTWVDDRERYLAERLRYDNRDRYYDSAVWGAEELDAYGDWVQHCDYGYVWRPRATAMNVYHDWAPYRYGGWTWCPPYGWTWVGDEPWGWAPYHYGRWVYVDNYWCWAPRGYAGYRRRSWWRPALVSFTFVLNNHVVWYPLGYHQRDPRSRSFRNFSDRLRAVGSARAERLERTNPIYQRAVTTLPARGFGRSGVRAQAAPRELALRAVTAEPVSGNLPIRPAEADAAGAGVPHVNADRRRPRPLVRAGADGTVRALPERGTGAAERRPGVRLAEELQRTRVFNNRQPRPAAPPDATTNDRTEGDRGQGSGAQGSDSRPTGAVARPARPRWSERIGGGGEGSTPARPTRPEAETVQPPAADRPDRVERPPADGIGGGDEGRPRFPRERPARPAPSERDSTEGDIYRPQPAPRREERHEPPIQRRADPAPREERPAPPPREQPRYERPERHEERPAPPPREERSAPPPQREERSAPEPRHEERPSAPPPQREERRAEPPPERHAPARPSSKRPDDN